MGVRETGELASGWGNKPSEKSGVERKKPTYQEKPSILRERISGVVWVGGVSMQV